VAEYQIYFVDARGRVSMGEAFGCDNEDEAVDRLATAEQADAEFVELWRGGHLVRRIPRPRPQI